MPAGCARPPWGAILSEDEAGPWEAAYQRLQQQTRQCPAGLNGEALVTWDGSVGKRSFTGFTELLAPAYLKFIAHNPLGQPVWAITTNGRDYQVIDTSKRTYTAGSLRSYALRHDIPPSFLGGRWFAWLTARPPGPDLHVVERHKDTAGRGVWLGVAEPRDGAPVRERLLVDTEHRSVLERIVVGTDGTTLATVVYGDWQDVGNCPQPTTISVTGLSFGTTATLSLTEVQPVRLLPEQFTIRIPPGYLRQYQP